MFWETFWKIFRCPNFFFQPYFFLFLQSYFNPPLHLLLWQKQKFVVKKNEWIAFGGHFTKVLLLPSEEPPNNGVGCNRKMLLLVDEKRRRRRCNSGTAGGNNASAGSEKKRKPTKFVWPQKGCAEFLPSFLGRRIVDCRPHHLIIVNFRIQPVPSYPPSSHFLLLTTILFSTTTIIH